jgi:hypothetical protein
MNALAHSAGDARAAEDAFSTYVVPEIPVMLRVCGLEAEAYEDLKRAVNRSASLPSDALARLRTFAESLTRP